MSFKLWRSKRVRSASSLSAPSMIEALEPRLLLSGSPAMTYNGIGGGGAMYQVTISPYDSQYMLLACDMSGDYVSTNGGAQWQMINYKQIDSSRALRPVFSATRAYWVDTMVNDLRYSSDHGQTWTNLLSGTAPWSDSILELGVISGSPDKVFVGTPSGLWQSQDGGTTWTQAATGNCTSIATIDQRVYATVGTTLQSSLNGGLTWAPITVTGAGTHTLKNVGGAQVGSNAPYLFVIVDQVGVIRSTDGGLTWGTVQASNLQSEVLMPQGQTQIVYSVQEGVQGAMTVWKSTNGGTTWASAFRFGSNVTQTWIETQLHWGYYIMDGGLGVAPSDPNILFLATQGELYKSTNGGTTWAGAMATDVTSTLHKSIGMEVTGATFYEWDPNNYNNRYVGFADITLIRSNDAGASWTWSATGDPWLNTMYRVVFDPSTPGKMYGAASTEHNIPEWGGISDATSYTGGVVVSTNSGATWSKLGTGLPAEPCTDVLIDPTSPASARVMYATMYYSGVWKSVDGGATWVQKPGVGFLSNKHAWRLARDAATGTLYCLVTATRTDSTFSRGGLWKSSDGGDSWTQITSGLLAWPTDVAVVDVNTIYLSVADGGGYSQSAVWKTTNGGHAWTQVLTSAPLAAWHSPGYSQAMSVKVFPDNPNIVYCATTSQGLWVSQDAGSTWNPFPNLGFQSPAAVAFDPHDHTQMYISTWGGGVWQGFYLPSLPGDANGDGIVNFKDYIVLEGNFGKTGTTFAQGDFNGDGRVDFKDYIMLESNFGSTGSAAPAGMPLALSASTSTTVEPASLEQARQFLLPSVDTGSDLQASLAKLRLKKALN